MLLISLLFAAATCVDIPFHWTPGQVEIEVSVNGLRPRWFVLDSGAEYHVIGTDLAKELALPTKPRLGRDFASALAIEFGGVTLRDQDAMVMPLDNFKKQHRDIHGLIGYDFFASRAVTIDYQKHVVRACPASSFEPAPDDVAVPMDFAGRLPVVPVRLTLAGGRTLSLRAMVDLGAQAAMIVRYPYAEAHKLFEGARDTSASPSLYGPQAMKTIATKSIALGPTTLAVSSVRVFGAPSGSGGFTESDALIGNELLQRARVTFDYAHRRLLLAPVP
jgi:hypothetical protein